MHIAQALYEMQALDQGRNAQLREEFARGSATLDLLAGRIESQLADDKEQRHIMAAQLSQLAGSLGSLVNHLQDLSHLMADILERLAEPPPRNEPEPEAEIVEPLFSPGGEGITLTVAGVPDFASLMEIQKGLQAIEQVARVSVERYQDGESRVLLQLSDPISGSDLAEALRRSTTHAFIVEEARPEILLLKLKIVPGA